MPADHYDVAVLGLGSMGSFACMDLARRGIKVIGLDRHHPPHAYGSHGGEMGASLLTRCGSVNVGKPDSLLIAGLLRSSAMHGIPVVELTREQMQRDYPAIHVGEGEIGVLEPGAGWVHVDKALSFALDAVRKAGGELRLGTEVRRWERDGDGVRLEIDGEPVYARRLIVCAGAWASTQLQSLQLPLRVLRKVLVWLRPREEYAELASRMPVTGFADASSIRSQPKTDSSRLHSTGLKRSTLLRRTKCPQKPRSK